jgi:hypothetical protein
MTFPSRTFIDYQGNIPAEWLNAVDEFCATSTTVGQAVLTAVDAAAARTAIGAGTSNLAIGTTGTTAKAGNWFPTWAEVTSKPSTFTPSAHVHAIADVTGLQTALDAKAPVVAPAFTGGASVTGQFNVTHTSANVQAAFGTAANRLQIHSTDSGTFFATLSSTNSTAFAVGAQQNIPLGFMTNNVWRGEFTAGGDFNVSSTAVGAARILRVINNSTTVGTQARVDLSTGTANAYAIAAITEAASPSFELSNGPGLIGGLFLTSATTSTPIVLRNAGTEKLRTTTTGVQANGDISLTANSGASRTIGVNAGGSGTTLVLAGAGASGQGANIELAPAEIRYDSASHLFRSQDGATRHFGLSSTGAMLLGNTLAAGTSGQVLQSSGTGGPPVWASVPGAAAASETVAGVLEIATAAEAQALSSNALAITPARLASAFQGANQSLATSGHQVLPGGLIWQWGFVAAGVGTGNSDAVTFPIPFPTAVFNVQLTIQHATAGSSGGLDAAFLEDSVTTTGFTFSRRFEAGGSGGVSTQPTYWFAIGR